MRHSRLAVWDVSIWATPDPGETMDAIGYSNPHGLWKIKIERFDASDLWKGQVTPLHNRRLYANHRSYYRGIIGLLYVHVVGLWPWHIYIYIAIIIMCSGARRKAMVTYLRGVAIKMWEFWPSFGSIYRLLSKGRIHLGVWTRKTPFKYACDQ